MNITFYLAPVLVLTVSLLIWAEMTERKKLIFLFKPISTLIVITAALMSFWLPATNQVYAVGVLVGLLLSIGGDIALMYWEKRKAFLLGLVLFLLAHIAYTVVFTLLGRFSAWDILSTLLLVMLGIGFYRLVKPNLGKMKLPVIMYIIVISLMVSRALSTIPSPIFSREQAWMIFAGAVLFYISDVILAIARFWKPWRYHRISLAFYYSGQMLIALAASLFR